MESLSSKKQTNLSKRANKALSVSVLSSGGRSGFGRISVHGRGKRRWRHSYRLDWLHRVLDEIVEVAEIRRDPSRTGNVALGFIRRTGLFEYSLAAEGLLRGGLLINACSPYVAMFNSKNKLNRKGIGNSYPLETLSVGVRVFSLELLEGSGGSAARAAGASARVLQKIKVFNQTFVAVRLQSGQLKYLSGNCRAVLGQVSNARHRSKTLGTAGASRRLGFRSHVRGVAMNPIDHPHGGGEGKTSGGRPSVSPWGRLTKGKRTTPIKRRQKRKKLIRRLRQTKRFAVKEARKAKR